PTAASSAAMVTGPRPWTEASTARATLSPARIGPASQRPIATSPGPGPTPSTSDRQRFRRGGRSRSPPCRFLDVLETDRVCAAEIGDGPRDAQQPLGTAPRQPLRLRQAGEPDLVRRRQPAHDPERPAGYARVEQALLPDSLPVAGDRDAGGNRRRTL